MNRPIIVLERDHVIAADIADTVAETVAGACLIAVGSIGEVMESLRKMSADGGTAILHATEAELREPGLASALASTGTATIAIHAPLSGASFENWVYLPPPFTADTLRSALRCTGR